MYRIGNDMILIILGTRFLGPGCQGMIPRIPDFSVAFEKTLIIYLFKDNEIISQNMKIKECNNKAHFKSGMISFIAPLHQ
jgi:hypothetical protein